MSYLCLILNQLMCERTVFWLSVDGLWVGGNYFWTTGILLMSVLCFCINLWGNKHYFISRIFITNCIQNRYLM